MGLLKRIAGVWNEYKRDKIGMVGLGLLVLFLFVAVAFPVIGNEEVIENWDNYQYFRFYPKNAPPCWASIITGEKYTRTIIADGKAVEVIRDTGVDEQRNLPYVNVTIKVPVDVTGTAPPNDVLLVMDLHYNSSRYPVYVTGLSVVRPDGEVFHFVPPGKKVPINSILVGLPARKVNATDLVLSFKSLTENQFLVQRFIIPELRNMGIQVSVVDIANIMLTIFDAVFSKDIVAAFKGNATEAQEGRYWWVLQLYGYNASINVAPKRLVVMGACYGVLGTDNQGRDLWQGVLYGVRWALIVGLLASTLSVLIGSLYGIVSGYFGGVVDEVMMRVAQIIYSLPALPILILLAALYKPTIWLIVFMIVAFGWPGVAIVTRSMALQVRQEPYVESAIALGASTKRILFLYIMPQVLPYMFATIALSVPGAIIAEASLSFLGVGDPSVLTWGRILHEAETANAALNGYWWWVLPPGLGIALVGLSFVFIGNALDRILNPRLRR